MSKRYPTGLSTSEDKVIFERKSQKKNKNVNYSFIANLILFPISYRPIFSTLFFLHLGINAWPSISIDKRYG